MADTLGWSSKRVDIAFKVHNREERELSIIEPYIIYRSVDYQTSCTVVYKTLLVGNAYP